MHLNPHSIPPILCLLFSLIIGLFILSRNPKSAINKNFFGICLSFVLWLSFYIPYNLNFSEEKLIHWFRIAYCGIIFIGIMCFNYTTIFLNIPNMSFWRWFNILIGLTFCIINLTTNLFISGAYLHS